ncbi:hypothetical protein TNCV_117851 [Trichonephila clavipes]|nr:hypothetical protein TNCV_117851 [Trichonephila clavipes]
MLRSLISITSGILASVCVSLAKLSDVCAKHVIMLYLVQFQSVFFGRFDTSISTKSILKPDVKKPHTIAEELILPTAIEIVETMFGDNFAKELQSIPLSNDTASRRIDDIAEDEEQQLFRCSVERRLCYMLFPRPFLQHACSEGWFLTKNRKLKEQKNNLKFCLKFGKISKETGTMLVRIHVDQALSMMCVYNWFTRFLKHKKVFLTKPVVEDR